MSECLKFIIIYLTTVHLSFPDNRLLIWTAMTVLGCWSAAENDCGTREWFLLNATSLFPINVSNIVSILLGEFFAVHLLGELAPKQGHRFLQGKSYALRVSNTIYYHYFIFELNTFKNTPY